MQEKSVSFIQFLPALLHFLRCVMRMESILLFHIVQMPVAWQHRCVLLRKPVETG